MGGALNSLVFQPPPVTYTHGQNNRSIFWLTTVEGRQLPALFLDQKARVTLLFSHGNAEDLGMIYDWLVVLSLELRVNVLAYDYEGYGRAGGSPCERGCFAAIDAAYAFLVDGLSVPPSNIVLYGRSLGTGPSLYLAARLAKLGERLGGLILQSALLSALRVAFPLRYTLPGDLFVNIDRAPEVRCPTLVVHGTRDEVIPFTHGQEIFLTLPIAHRARPFWIDGGGHNNLETFFRSNSIFLEPLRSFLLANVTAYHIAFFAWQQQEMQQRPRSKEFSPSRSRHHRRRGDSGEHGREDQSLSHNGGRSTTNHRLVDHLSSPCS